VEDPTFSLVRHLPRDEQCDGSFWLGIWPATFMVNHSEIERFIHWSGSSLGVPSYFWRSPKYDWWSGNGREVNEGFCALLAKRAKPVIRPSTVGQAIGSPNPILNSKPRKKKTWLSEVLKLCILFCPCLRTSNPKIAPHMLTCPSIGHSAWPSKRCLLPPRGHDGYC
jgi:hypothetical protein